MESIKSSMKIFLLVACFCSCIGTIAAQDKTPVILDTDMGPDYDDVGAIAMLHTLADSGKADILATMSNNHHYLTGPTIQLFNTYFKRPGIPVGVPKGVGVCLGAWQKWPQLLLARHPHTSQSNDDFPDAVSVYRQILSKAADNSIVIISTGFFTNLSGLLNSKGDQIAAFSGKELIKRKVKKLVAMAGRFPEGREFNIYRDTVSAMNVINNWPGKIIFSGFEIGDQIKTGLGLLRDHTLKNSPVKDAYMLSMAAAAKDSLGRRSWDQTAVLIGIEGAGPYFNVERGAMRLLEDGKNYWIKSATGSQYYVIQKMGIPEITAIIERLMHR